MLNQLRLGDYNLTEQAMRKLLVVGLVLAISGCGEFKDLPPKVSNGNGGTVAPGTTYPKDESSWKYGSVSDGDGVFSLTARIDATNTYTVPKYPNLKQRSWIELEKRKMSGAMFSKRFIIFAPEQLKCTPNCEIRIKFNSRIDAYNFVQKSDGVLTPVSDQLSAELFDKTTQSSSATIYLPIVGLLKDVESKFNLSGYDKNKMTFTDE